MFIPRSARRCGVCPRQRVDDDDDDDQHHAEADRERQVAFGGLQCDRRRHRAGEALDVAADDDDGADFRRRAAEPGEQSGNEREASIPDQRAHPAQRADVHCRELGLILHPQVFDRLSRQSRDDRRDQHGLRDDHRLRREQQAPFAERPRSRQQEKDRKADDDRRQAHQRIKNDDDSLAAAKTRECEQCAGRHPDQGSEQDCAQTDQQRQAHDREQAWVAAEHQLERGFTFSHWRAITSQGGQGLMLRPPKAPVLVADIAR